MKPEQAPELILQGQQEAARLAQYKADCTKVEGHRLELGGRLTEINDFFNNVYKLFPENIEGKPVIALQQVDAASDQSLAGVLELRLTKLYTRNGYVEEETYRSKNEQAEGWTLSFWFKTENGKQVQLKDKTETTQFKEQIKGFSRGNDKESIGVPINYSSDLESGINWVKGFLNEYYPARDAQLTDVEATMKWASEALKDTDLNPWYAEAIALREEQARKRHEAEQAAATAAVEAEVEVEAPPRRGLLADNR